MNAREVMTAIGAGEFDTNLQDIINAVDARRGVLNALRAEALQVGDYVMLKGYRPKWFNGKPVRVVSKNGKDITVDMTEICRGTRYHALQTAHIGSLVEVPDYDPDKVLGGR